MKDRYANWYRETKNPIDLIVAPRGSPDLEHIVLADLDRAQSDEEKVDILDSYSLASQRQYRNQLVSSITQTGQNVIGHILRPLIDIQLPDPSRPFHMPVAPSSEARVVDSITCPFRHSLLRLSEIHVDGQLIEIDCQPYRAR